MITKANRKKLLKTIGHGHIQKIHDFMIENKIFRDNEEPYSKSHISNVFNGVDHEIIEDAILDCGLHYKKLERLRKEKIESLKTA